MKFRNRIVFCVMLCVLPFVIGAAEGAFVNEQSARIVAQNWINISGNKFAKDIGSQIKDATHLQGENYGNPGYYFMTLSPRGWLIVPADDAYEAILAFGQGSLLSKEYIKSPFAKILCVNSQESFKGDSAMSMNSQRVKKPQNKRWGILLQKSNYEGARALNSGALTEIYSDVVVDKLLGDNNWQQRELIAFDANGNANVIIPLFFNRYVTWDDDIRYPVGCLPLSTSQIMKYYGHPTTPPMFGSAPLIGVSFDVALSNDNVPQRTIETAIKGGTLNGSYNWSLMPNNLNASVFSNLADDRPGDGNIVSNPNSYEYKVREEISRLLHDLGVLTGAIYSYVGTTAGSRIIASTFMDNLNYFSAISAGFTNTQIPDVLKTNLDNAYPVLFACNVSDMNGIGGHRFVVDGYGYQIYGVEDDKVAYFHCSLGWGDPRFNVWVPLIAVSVII